MATQRGKKIAEVGEILAFYTSVMRGEEEDATMTNRISAADKLLTRNDEADQARASVEKLDALLLELKQAVREGRLVASGEEEAEELVTEELSTDGEEESEEEDWDEDQ